VKIKLFAVGKLKTDFAKLAAAEFYSRIVHYVPFEIVEIKEGATINYLDRGYYNILLDMHGSELTSEKFAAFIERKLTHYKKDIAFFVGGAEGFSDAEREKADFLLSLSKMTLPHELARVFILEQIYRAFTIIRGEKYHK
jgi:23S rRNA (pseudouridine1915-N3)-methyltransferase